MPEAASRGEGGAQAGFLIRSRYANLIMGTDRRVRQEERNGRCG